MLYRGVVIEISNRYAVIVTNHMQYYKIRKKDAMKAGREILFLDEDILKDNHAVLSFAKRAAIFLLMLMSTFLFLYGGPDYRTDKKAVAIVSIDINPSVELEINKSNSVINIIALNEESREIITPYMEGKPVNQVVLCLLLNAKQAGYIRTDNQEVLVASTVLLEYSQSPSSILTELRQTVSVHKELERIGITYLEISEELAQNARTHHLTIGREGIYQSLKKHHVEVKREEIRGMGVGELLRRNRERWGQREENENMGNHRWQSPPYPIPSNPQAPPETGSPYQNREGSETGNDHQHGYPKDNDSGGQHGNPEGKGHEGQHGKPNDKGKNNLPESEPTPTPTPTPSPGDTGSIDNPKQEDSNCMVLPVQNKKPEELGNSKPVEDGPPQSETGKTDQGNKIMVN